MASAVKHTAQEARVSIVDRPSELGTAAGMVIRPMLPSCGELANAAASCGKLRVRVYHLRPIACQTVKTATARRIVIRAHTMLYRGMDRAQLDAAYKQLRGRPEHDAIVADWAAGSAKARREYAGRVNFAYDDTPRERLDLFLADFNSRISRAGALARQYSRMADCAFVGCLRASSMGGVAMVRSPQRLQSSGPRGLDAAGSTEGYRYESELGRTRPAAGGYRPEVHKRLAATVVVHPRKRSRKQAAKALAMGFITGQENQQIASWIAAARTTGEQLSDVPKFWN